LQIKDLADLADPEDPAARVDAGVDPEDPEDVDPEDPEDAAPEDPADVAREDPAAPADAGADPAARTRPPTCTRT